MIFKAVNGVLQSYPICKKMGTLCSVSMFSSVKLIVFFVFFSTFLEANAQHKLWTLGTAKTHDKGEVTLAVFSPSRYGLTNTLEINSHLFGLPLIPNVGVKKAWYLTKNEWLLSSNHALYYPTPALNVYSNYRFLPFEPTDSIAPPLIKFKNEVVVSKILKKKTFCEPANYLVSIKVGNISAIGFNDTTQQAIVYPVLYRNTAIFDKKYLWYTGFDLEAWYNEKINYSIDLDIYFLTPLVNYWFTESKILLSAKLTNRTNLYFGLKQVLENNPIGLQYRVFPLVEFTYNFRLKKAKNEERGLFENEFYMKPKKKKEEQKTKEEKKSQ